MSPKGVIIAVVVLGVVMMSLNANPDMLPLKRTSSLNAEIMTEDVLAWEQMRVEGTLEAQGWNDVSPISRAVVTAKITRPDNKVEIRNIMSDEDGDISLRYTPTMLGQHQLSMVYAGDDDTKGASSSLSFTASRREASVAEPEETPIPYDYKVSSSAVLNESDATVYTGADFTTALNWALDQTSSTVYVPEGTYEVTEDLVTEDGVTLIGEGAGETVLNFTTIGSDAVIVNYNGNSGTSNVTLEGFTIQYGWVTMGISDGTSIGNFTFRDVTIENTRSSRPYAIGTWVDGNSTIDTIEFDNVRVDHADTYGFSIQGEGIYDFATRTIYHNWVKNITYRDCYAGYCGVGARYNDWVTGFNWELVHVENVTMTDCESQHSWESGFHFEDWGYCLNATITDCVSSYSGADKPLDYVNDDSWVGPRYAYGFFFDSDYSDVTCTGCSGTGNFNGLGV